MTPAQRAAQIAAKDTRVVELKTALDRAQRQHAKLKASRLDILEAIRQGAHDALLSIDFPPIAEPPKDKRPAAGEVAVAILADWQLGKRTESYSTRVCEERIALYADKVIELTEIQRKAHPVRKCRVWALGDLVEGELIFPDRLVSLRPGGQERAADSRGVPSADAFGLR